MKTHRNNLQVSCFERRAAYAHNEDKLVLFNERAAVCTYAENASRTQTARGLGLTLPSYMAGMNHTGVCALGQLATL